MAYIKAYSDENARHPDLFPLSAGSDEQVSVRAAVLMDAFALPLIDVVFTKRKGGAHFRPGMNWTGVHLAFTPNDCSLLTLAHEVAHYLTTVRRGMEWNRLNREISHANDKMVFTKDPAVRAAAIEQKKLLIAKRDEIKNRGAHTKDFAKNVDEVCAYIRAKTDWKDGAVTMDKLTRYDIVPTTEHHPVAAKTAPSPYAAYKDANLVERYMKALPDLLQCRKCYQHKPKEQVGVRVMSRSPEGYPAKLSRQSYCSDCRKKK